MSHSVAEYVGGPRDGETLEFTQLPNEILIAGRNPEYNPFACMWNNHAGRCFRHRLRVAQPITQAGLEVIVEQGFKPMTPWQWLEQDLTLFALYCMCDGRQRMIGTREQGMKERCCICSEYLKPRKEAGL